jgi:biopolymer transport protein ExbD
MAQDFAIDFHRTSRRKMNELNLIPLIDVLFILIIFFMLTTSFMRIESLELVLPSAAGKAADKPGLVRLFVHANGDMMLGQRKVDQDALDASLKRMFDMDPNTRIMLLTADGVTMQQMVNVMDRIYLSGGKSLMVKQWNKK